MGRVLPDEFALLAAALRVRLGTTLQDSAPSGRPRSAGDAWPRPREGAWEALPALAQLHRLAPPVAQALVACAPDDAPRPAVIAFLQEHCRTIAVRALAALRPLAEVLDALGARGIPALLWKGPALAQDAWGDVGTRASVDLDIVVRPRDRARARAVVGRLGWRETHGMSAAQERAIFRGRGAWELAHPAHQVKLELHWEFSARRYPGRLPVEEVFVRSEERTLGGVRVRVPGPGDTLVLLAQHGSKHGWSSLEDVALFAAILARHPDRLPEACARAERLGLARPMALAGALTGRAFGIAVPDELAAEAADPALSPLLAEVEARWRRGDVAWRPSLAWDLACATRTRDRARMLWRSLVDPTVQEWLAVRLPDPLAWLYPVVRPGRLLLRALRRDRPLRAEPPAPA